MDEQARGWGTVTPRRCRRHEWVSYPLSLGAQIADRSHLPGDIAAKADRAEVIEYETRCRLCGQPQDIAASSRGKRNRQRGNAIERWVCKLLGIERRGQYGGLDDGGGSKDFIVVQVKSGGAFTEGRLAKIHTIPVNADQLRGWVTVSTPGAGHQREGVISFDLREFAAWYGKGNEEAA